MNENTRRNIQLVYDRDPLNIKRLYDYKKGGAVLVRLSPYRYVPGKVLENYGVRLLIRYNPDESKKNIIDKILHSDDNEEYLYTLWFNYGNDQLMKPKQRAKKRIKNKDD